MQYIVVMTARQVNLQANDWVVNGIGRKGMNLRLGRQCDWFLLSMAAYLTKFPYGVGILLLNTESSSSPMCILTVTIRLKTPSWTFRP